MSTQEMIIKKSKIFSIGHAEYIARTDLAISQLEPWRGKIPVKFLTTRIRFQIRIDDLRQLVKVGKAQIDDILEFYNTATDALLNQYGTEVRLGLSVYVSGMLAW